MFKPVEKIFGTKKEFQVKIFLDNQINGLVTTIKDVTFKEAKKIIQAIDQEMKKKGKWLRAGYSLIRKDKIVAYEICKKPKEGKKPWDIK